MPVGTRTKVTSQNLNPKGGAWRASWHPVKMEEHLDLSIGAQMKRRSRRSARPRKRPSVRFGSAGVKTVGTTAKLGG